MLFVAVTRSTAKFAEKITKPKLFGIKWAHGLTTIIAQPILQFHKLVEVSEREFPHFETVRHAFYKTVYVNINFYKL